jgi:hypothetical protein
MLHGLVPHTTAVGTTRCPLDLRKQISAAIAACRQGSAGGLESEAKIPKICKTAMRLPSDVDETGFCPFVLDPEGGTLVPAIKRGINATQKGKPAPLEFITTKEIEVSKF